MNTNALGGDVFALPIGEGTDATRQPIPIVQTPAREFGPDLSPDSRWIVYISERAADRSSTCSRSPPGAPYFALRTSHFELGLVSSDRRDFVEHLRSHLDCGVRVERDALCRRQVVDVPHSQIFARE
jgi:hypothetical protein